MIRVAEVPIAVRPTGGTVQSEAETHRPMGAIRERSLASLRARIVRARRAARVKAARAYEAILALPFGWNFEDAFDRIGGVCTPCWA